VYLAVGFKAIFEGAHAEVEVSRTIGTSAGTATDTHSLLPQWAVKGPGEVVFHQLFVYGSPLHKAAPNSGFQITHKVEEIAKDRFKVTTMKIGASTKFRKHINSSSGNVEAPDLYSSEAGAGRGCVIQIVEKGGIKPNLIKADNCIR
jgi:hypothetical protein